MLRDIRPTWIAFGWFIGLAVTGLIVLAFSAVGLLGPDPEAGDVWVATAILIGFLAGGFFVGARAGAAPVLHGLGIGLFTVVVWLLLNLFLGEPTGAAAWTAMPTSAALGLLLLQAVAAVVGARMGVRLTHTPPAEVGR